MCNTLPGRRDMAAPEASPMVTCFVSDGARRAAYFAPIRLRSRPYWLVKGRIVLWLSKVEIAEDSLSLEATRTRFERLS